VRYPQTFIEDLRRQADIVRVVGDYVTLKKKGANWMACCPFHQEKTPSFSVNPSKNIFYCFGCLEESEHIWTEGGLKAIGEVRAGERVLDRYGRWAEVLNVIHKSADALLGFTTAAFRHDPLWLTPDHTCIFARQEDVIASVPYIFKTADRDVRFASSQKNTRRIGKYRDTLRLTEARADEVCAGDYFVFPVIPDGERSASALRAPGAINPRENRVNGVRVEALPVNERTARLYGLWLAEGSVGRGFVRWTFHSNSVDTLAAEVVTTLREEFGLPATIYQYPEKPNTCEVNCSKTDLALQLTHWFGRGAANKRLPAEMLYWPANLQKAFLSGYRDGDGDSRGMSTSISQLLSYGVFALAIQARENIALDWSAGYTDKTGLNHKECWHHYPRQRESCNGFYETVEGVTYYFSPVVTIHENDEPKRVVDITVSETSSFTTKLGTVHNCAKGGSVFNFVMELEGVSFPESVRIVAEKVGMPLPELVDDKRFEAKRKEADEVIELNAWALEFWERQLAEEGAEARAAREYVEGRGISGETVRTFRLGYAPNSWEALGNYLRSKGAGIGQIERSGLVVKKEQGGYYDRFRGRLIFPVTDAQGRPVAFGARALRPGDEPKYLNSPETAAYTKGRHLFGLSVTREEIRRKKFAILVEGYLDLIVPFQHGVRNVVASLGTALTAEQARLLNRFARKVVVNYDGDRAGINAAKRAIEVLLPEDFEVKVLVLPEGADPDEFVRAHGADEYNRRRGEAAPHMQFVLEQAMRDRNLHNPPEKSEAVAEVLPFVRAVRNPIQRREYFDISMDSLRVEDLSLRQELWKSVSARDPKAAASNEEIKKKVARASVGAMTESEKILLELLLHDADLRGHILPQLYESDYEGLASAAIFEALRRADAEGVEVGFDSLNELIGDDPAQAFLPELWMHEPGRAEGEAVDVFLAQAEGCLVTLRQMSYERRIKELAAEIAAAGRAGDESLHGSLLMKKFELEKQLAAMRPRTGGPASPSTT
jgi:DNA primase